jgi:G:T-mismatch repair DNA endonuclease (very short patch repair protein)
MDRSQQFIKKAIKVHGNKYDYSKIEYINNRIGVVIICNNHDEIKEFTQIPGNHLKGHGCKYCKAIKLSNTFKKTNQNFINECINKYKNLYDFSKVKYENNKKKVIIICNLHGEFTKSPCKILAGEGCQKCSIDKISNKYRKDLVLFIKQANIIHNFKYDYSKVNYINTRTKIIIVCKIHGDFTQSPGNHFKYEGCAKCTNNQFSKSQIKWLEFLEIYYNINIQHMGNSNQEYKIKNTKWKADGYCKETNTIFEYHGSFWHGDPKIYKPDDMNNVSKRTMGTLYKRTINRENKIKELGYNLEVMWESNWNNINKSISILQKKFRTCKSLNLLV